MTIKILSLTVLILTLGACKSQKTSDNTSFTEISQQPVTPKENQNGLVYLKEGEKKFLKDKEMNITFKKVLEDSRCPEGMQCVWAGLLALEIEVMGTYTRPQTFILSSKDIPERNYSKKVEFNDYTISLETFTPTKTQKPTKEVRTLGLKIEKTGTTSATTR